MELKKNPQVDVHQRKSTNLLIGLNAALILILGLFFYASNPDKPKNIKKSANNEQIELIPPTEQEPPKAPPPPPSPEIIEIEDDSDEEETETTTTEATENTEVKPIQIEVGTGDEPKIEIDNTIYLDVDESGEFIGGEDKLQEFATINFNMPKIADDLEISGTIFIQFVVERDGKITQLRAIAPKERQLGYGLEEECMRVIKLTSGKWKPAKRAGKAVRSYWRFPFEVDNSSSF